MAAGTNYCSLGGLKQQKCVLEVLKPRSLELVSRGWNQGLRKTTVLLEAPRGKSAPCLFQLLLEVPHSWVYGHIPPISGSVCVKSPLGMWEGSCDGIEGPSGQSRIIAQLKILNLTHLQDPFEPYKVTCTGSGDQGLISLGAVIQLLQNGLHMYWSFHHGTTRIKHRVRTCSQ